MYNIELETSLNTSREYKGSTPRSRVCKGVAPLAGSKGRAPGDPQKLFGFYKLVHSGKSNS